MDEEGAIESFQPNLNFIRAYTPDLFNALERDGVELVGDFPKGWIARDEKFREGEFEGKDFQLELRAERSK